MNNRVIKTVDFDIIVSPDEDDEYRDKQARLLRDLIEDQIDEAEVILGQPGALPEGVRGGGGLSIGDIVLKAAPGAVTGVLGLIKNWVARDKDRKVTISAGDKKIEITGAVTPEELERYVESFKRLQ